MIPSNLNTHQEKIFNPTLKGIQQTQATNNLKHNTQHPIKKQKKKKENYQECKEAVKYDP